MKSQFVFLADGGHLKTYLLDRQNTPTLRFTHQYDVAEGLGRAADVFTDRAGGFPNSGTTGNGMAERHGIELENANRSARHISEKIADVLTQNPQAHWILVAQPALQRGILSGLSRPMTQRMDYAVKKDLTNQSERAVMAHLHVA